MVGTYLGASLEIPSYSKVFNDMPPCYLNYLHLQKYPWEKKEREECAASSHHAALHPHRTHTPAPELIENGLNRSM